jgi:hypothetical protein
LFQYVGLTPLIAASDPGQKKQAATIPWLSPVTQIGSPPYQVPSVTVLWSRNE